MWILFTALALAADPVVPTDSASPDPSALEIPIGKSIVIEFSEAPSALSVTDETVAIAMKLGDDRLWQIQGKRIGKTDMAVIVKGKVELYDLAVQRDVSELQKAVNRIARDK